MPARRQLQPRQGVDGHGVGGDAVNVAERDVDLACGEEPAEALAEARQVAPGDRPVDGELERARRVQGHRSVDRGRSRNSSAWVR